MNKNEAKQNVVKYWLDKADEAVLSAKSEMAASRFIFAMNRAYYACFYAASSLLLNLDLRFTKHSGVRSALHQHVVKKGLMSVELGKIYDRLFDNRQEGDYIELIQFEKEQVQKAIEDAAKFTAEIRKLLVNT